MFVRNYKNVKNSIDRKTCSQSSHFRENNQKYLRWKCDEELLQIQFRILGKRYLYPKRWLKIVHVYIKRGQCNIILNSKIVFRFGKTRPKRWTIQSRVYVFLLFGQSSSNSYIHFCHNRTGDCKICIYICFGGWIFKMYLGEMSILFFW